MYVLKCCPEVCIYIYIYIYIYIEHTHVLFDASCGVKWWFHFMYVAYIHHLPFGRKTCVSYQKRLGHECFNVMLTGDALYNQCYHLI